MSRIGFDMRDWAVAEISEADAALSVLAAVLETLWARSGDLVRQTGSMIEFSHEKPCGDDVEELVESALSAIRDLRRRGADLEQMRWQGMDLWDDAVSALEGFSEPGGWMEVQRNTDPFYEDVQVMDRIGELRAKYDDSTSLYVSLEKRIKDVLSTVDWLLEDVSKRISFLENRLETLKEV